MPPVRYIQGALLFLYLAVNYVTRMNLSLALVVMTKKNSTANEDVFDWTPSQQGMLLSSFFWGYFGSNLCSSVLVTKFNPKMIMFVSSLLCSIASLLTPFLVKIGGFSTLLVLRVSLGLLQGVMLPSTNVLMSRWILPQERAKVATFVYGGVYLGSIIAFSSTGIIGSFSWPSVFYFSGILSLIWTSIWLKWGAQSPSSCSFLSPEEKTLIETSLVHTSETKNPKIPWGKILKNIPCYALVVVNICQMWGYWIIATQIPTYFSSIVHLNATYNGLVMALPFVCYGFVVFPLAIIADQLIKKKITSINFSRKFFTTLALWGEAIAMVVLAQTSSSPIAISMYTMTMILSGIITLGYNINQLDICPNFAGLLMGITNGLGNIASVVGPMYVGYVVYDVNNAELWRNVFYVSAVVFFVGNLVFLIFGSAEVQDFNYIPTDPIRDSEETTKLDLTNGSSPK